MSCYHIIYRCSAATWDNELKMAKVTVSKGKFIISMGVSIKGNEYLYAEEVLVLVDSGSLVVS